VGSRAFALVALGVVSVLLLVGCDDEGGGVRGSGNVITESRDVSGFDEIVVLGSGDVIVTVTGTESLTIEAEDNVMPLLTTKVRDGRLELGSDGSFSTTRGITYTITAVALEGVAISGSGDVVASGIDASDFAVTIDGSGNITPAGTSEEVSVDINGSGGFDGEDLIASIGRVEISGSGDAVVNVIDDLTIRIGGSGDVEYLGNPTVSQDIGGSGSVSQR
jgi:hypothetical protein